MMYFVNLTLTGPEADYEPLHQAVKQMGPWSNRVASGYLVESTWSSVAIRDLLKPHLKDGDRVFVGEFIRNWAASGMGQDFPAWIGRRSFREFPAKAGPSGS